MSIAGIILVSLLVITIVFALLYVCNGNEILLGVSSVMFVLFLVFGLVIVIVGAGNRTEEIKEKLPKEYEKIQQNITCIKEIADKKVKIQIYVETLELVKQYNSDCVEYLRFNGTIWTHTFVEKDFKDYTAEMFIEDVENYL